MYGVINLTIGEIRLSQFVKIFFWVFRYIKPVENRLVSKLTLGEGWHNYHHTFPWDYKAAELDSYNGNVSTAFIDFMAKIGWAYELKTVPLDIIRKRVLRTGQ